MEYQITATLGPSSADETIWRAMLTAGVTAFRLNTSHLTLTQLNAWLERISWFLSSLDAQYSLVLDLQGSKWRLGSFAPFELSTGERLELVCSPATDRLHTLPVPHIDFFQAASSSSQEIVLNDARIRLHIESIEGDSLKARVVHGGIISAHKGITFTASNYRREFLNEKDQTILEQTRQFDFIQYALSYVKDGAEMAHYRTLFGSGVHLIAKIERQPAIDETLQIAQSADELWLCRGDLGAELGAQAMAAAVHNFSRLPANLALPVLMAGQVLEHMSANPDPTRSEVCYLYEALVQGYSGFVLSDETAVGQYPLESCRAAAMFKK
jgi:pyruvate kinase